MTIQDDKQYSLSGGQWKDLVARLSEGEIVQLTTDDYNYPTTEPNCIAPWLLPDGIYFATSEVAIKPDSNNPPFATQDSFIIRSGTRCFMAGPSNGGTFSGTYSNNGTLIAHSVSGGIGSELLNVNAINNNLTTTTTGHVLDARQGKVLKDTIDSLGTIKTLTTEDYNWRMGGGGANDTIGLWLLDDGVYSWEEGVYTTPASNESSANMAGFAVITSKSSTHKYILRALRNGNYQIRVANKTTGAVESQTAMLSRDSVQDTLTSTLTDFPLSAKQGKVLKGLVDAKEAITLTGTAAPTTSTEGTNVGQQYYDSTNDKWYRLKAIDTSTTPATYTWEEQTGGPTVVQTTGTSTTDVMSQNAVTGMVYNNNNTRRIVIGGTINSAMGVGVIIGGEASVSGTMGFSNTVIIGDSSTSSNSGNNVVVGSSNSASNAQNSVLIGYNGNTNSNGEISIGYKTFDLGGYHGKGAISLGAYSAAHNTGEMNIGSTDTSYGYNNSNYRLLTGLYDPQSAHDAATKGYVDGLVGNVESALNVINNGGSN